MPWRVQHLQYPIAQIQYVAIFDQARGRRCPHAVFGVAQWAIRVRLEHVVADEVGGQGIGTVRCGEDIGLGRMHQTLIELVMPGDMVEVAMTGHRQQRLFGQPRQLLAQADQPGTRVDQHVMLAPLHMPHVAAIEGAHVRLVDQADAIVAVLHLEPAVTADDFHGSSSNRVRTLRWPRWRVAPALRGVIAGRAGANPPRLSSRYASCARGTSTQRRSTA